MRVDNPQVGFVGFYTKRDSTKPRRWFACRVVGRDVGDRVVLRSQKWNYHGKKLSEFEFATEVPSNEISMGPLHE